MIIKSKMGNLGDNLWLTPLFVHGIAKKIILPDDKRCRAVGKIFENLGEVEFGDVNNEHCPESQDKIHRSAAHLKYFGCDKSPIPYVSVSNSETLAAQDLIKNITNPIVVNFTTFNKGGDWCSARRTLNHDQIKLIVKSLIDNGHTPVNFGLSSNTDDLEGVINILDLDIRITAACYKLIGKYIGSESGPPHLMLAAGGKIVVYHPDPDEIAYPAWKYHFTEEYWVDEPCRAKYVNFKDMNPLEDIKFLENT